MFRTAKEALAALDTFFAECPITQERSALWNILSALRGPDQKEHASLKAITTEIIRTRAFPKVAREYLIQTRVPAYFATLEEQPFVPNINTHMDHFLNHYWQALQALKDMGRGNV